MKELGSRRIPLLSKGQLALAITLVLLLIALAGVVVLATININTASSFQSGYVLTNLANVQREVIQLHMETNRVLRDRDENLESLDLQRAKLDTHLQLARAEAEGDSLLISQLRNLQMWLDHYDYEISRLRVNPTDTQFQTSSHQLDNVLGMLESEVQELYGSKELEFFRNIDGALELQRTSQALTVSIGGLLLLFGVLLIISLRRSVSGEFERAYDLLKAEVTERRRAEEELRQHNEYLAALHETSLALMNRLDTGDLLEAIISRAAQMLGTENAYVYLVEPATKSMVRRVGVGFFSRSIGHHIEMGQGIAGRVWETGEPLVVNDYGRWSARVPAPGVGDHQIKAMLGVPLTSGPETVGAIGLAYDVDSGRTFGDREVQLIEGFARLAAIALDNARLFDEADARTLQVEALYRADEQLYQHLQLEEVLSTLVNVAVDILKTDKSSLVVWNEDHDGLYPAAARGFQAETLERMLVNPDESLVGQVAQTARPIVVQDTTADRRVDWSLTYPERIRSFMHVPVVIDDEVFGVFTVGYTEVRAFDDDDLRLVTAFAQRAASAIRNARLYEQAQQAATLEERQRLARELHDAVTQTLFSASIIADILPRLWDRSPAEAKTRVDELRELTRGALAEMRTLLLELRPAALAETPIEELLHQLGEATIGRARVPVLVEAQVDCVLPLDVKVGFYRIAQEALNNIAKHAGASQVTVTLACSDGGAQLTVQDDGVGFEPTVVRPDNLGLRIMRERAAAIGAALRIDSKPGTGASIAAKWQPAPAQVQPLPSTDVVSM